MRVSSVYLVPRYQPGFIKEKGIHKASLSCISERLNEGKSCSVRQVKDDGLHHDRHDNLECIQIHGG